MGFVCSQWLSVCIWCLLLSSQLPGCGVSAVAVFETPAVGNQGIPTGAAASSKNRSWRNRPPRAASVNTGPTSSDSGSGTESEPGSGSEEVQVDTAGGVDKSQQPSAAHSTKFVAECLMPTSLGKFRMRSYTYSSEQIKNGMEPVVVIHGDVAGRDDVIVRVHDQCFTSEVFGSRRCDCREQLHESLKLVRKETGVVIYLQQEGRGIGLSNKVAAYSLQDNHGLDTVDANLHLGFKDELREYMAVPDILNDLGIKSIRLVTNNPFKIDQLTSLGVRINGRVTLDIPTNEHNIGYIRSKRDRMQHIFPKDEELLSPPGSAGRGGLALGLGSMGSSDTFARFFEETAKNAGARVLTSISGGVEAPAGSEEGGGVATATQAKAAHTPLTLEERMRKGFAFGRKSVEDAIEAIRQGKIVVVVDDEDRENEGDLIMAAEKATPETIGFIVRYTSGVLCAGMEADRLDALALPPMVLKNEDPKETAYTVSVDCKHGTTTGISASDRAVTFRALADASRFRAQDFQRPGHVFPLRYKPGGVLARAGHTEASVDLSKLAGLYPAGVLAEVVNDDGSIMRLPGLKALAAEHGLVLTSVQDLIAYRCESERQ